MKRKGFTLVELLVVIVIFSILITVMFRTYNTITELSIRSEFQKNIQTDVLFVNQIMHSLADEYTIDYGAYQKGEITNNGIINKLHLIKHNNPTETAMLRYKGDCYAQSPAKEIITPAIQNNYDCGIYYQKNNEKETRLTSINTLVTNVGWQLIPYQSNQTTLANKQNVYKTIAYPGVVMYWRAYHKGRGTKAITNVSQTLQRFFTLTDKPQL